jgi:hypothetical protein
MSVRAVQSCQRPYFGRIWQVLPDYGGRVTLIAHLEQQVLQVMQTLKQWKSSVVYRKQVCDPNSYTQTNTNFMTTSHDHL